MEISRISLKEFKKEITVLTINLAKGFGIDTDNLNFKWVRSYMTALEFARNDIND